MFAQRMKRVNIEKKKNLVSSSLGISEPTSEDRAVFPIPIAAAECSADVICQGLTHRSVGHSGQYHVLATSFADSSV